MKNRVFCSFVSAIPHKLAFLAAFVLWQDSVSWAEDTSPKMTDVKPFYIVTDGDRRFLAEVISAVERQDADWIAAHAKLPMVEAGKSGSKRKMIKTKKQLKSLLAGELTPALLKEMQLAAKEPLFVNYQGVMLGNGILWFSQTYDSDAKLTTNWILSFGNIVCQPR